MIDWLSRITVVDLTANVAGPFCTLILRDLGATVIKLEGVEGDAVRHWPPFHEGVSTTFTALNRGKDSVSLNLKDPRGAAAARRIVAKGDVFVESLRPRAASRLGLGWPELQNINPKLIYLSLNAYGDTGPLAGQPGFDAIVQAYSGLMDVTGYPDGPPARVGTGIVDFGTGLWAALSIIGALLQREHTGEGCQLESTLLGTAVSFLMHHITSASLGGVVPSRIGTAQHNTAPYEAVSAKDGMIMLGVANDALWTRLLEVIDDGRLAGDERFSTNPGRVANRAEIVQLIGKLLADRPGREVVRELNERGIPASVIRSVDTLVSDPQVEALGLLQRTTSGLRLPVAPVRQGSNGPTLGKDSPGLGASTEKILRQAGYSPTEIAGLINAKVAVVG